MELQIGIHWPHDRFCLGYDVIYPDDIYRYYTFTLYLLIFTLKLDVYE